MTRLKDGTSERLEAEACGEGEGGDDEEAGERLDVDAEEAGAEQVGEAERLESMNEDERRTSRDSYQTEQGAFTGVGPGKALTD